MTITVAAVNDAPTAVADVFTTTENVPLVVPAPGILANDTDVDSSALTALLVASVAPSSGTLSPITNGGFTYTPANGFSGPATFTYRAVDNATPPSQSAIATVTITVTGVNDAPVAATDVYAATEDTVLTIAAPGVLGNDTDPDTGTTLTALLVAPPTHGSLTLNANGSFTYSPARDYQGPDVFRYRARDNGTPPLQSNEANVTLNVGSVNDPPRFATGVTAIPNQTATRECGVDAAFARTVLRRPGSVAADDHGHWIAGRPQCHIGRCDSRHSGRCGDGHIHRQRHGQRRSESVRVDLHDGRARGRSHGPRPERGGCTEPRRNQPASHVDVHHRQPLPCRDRRQSVAAGRVHGPSLFR